jgi:hypothetical protein
MNASKSTLLLAERRGSDSEVPIYLSKFGEALIRDGMSSYKGLLLSILTYKKHVKRKLHKSKHKILHQLVL